MDPLVIGFALSVFIAMMLAVLAVYLWWDSRHSSAARRFSHRLKMALASSVSHGGTDSILKQRMLSESPFITSLLLRMPRVHALDRQLQQSGLKWSVARFITYTLLCAAAGAFAGFVLHTPALVVGAFAALAGLLPTMVLRRKRTKRVRQLERQLPDAADLIARALRAGHSFPAALGMVGQELPEPLGGRTQARAEHDGDVEPSAQAVRDQLGAVGGAGPRLDRDGRREGGRE